jgi:hypothetical protein
MNLPPGETSNKNKLDKINIEYDNTRAGVDLMHFYIKKHSIGGKR